MECPICHGVAEEGQPVNMDAKLVRCEVCGPFQISGTAEAVLAERDGYQRLQALRYAQTNVLAGRFPYIHGVI